MYPENTDPTTEKVLSCCLTTRNASAQRFRGFGSERRKGRLHSEYRRSISRHFSTSLYYSSIVAKPISRRTKPLGTHCMTSMQKFQPKCRRRRDTADARGHVTDLFSFCRSLARMINVKPRRLEKVVAISLIPSKTRTSRGAVCITRRREALLRAKACCGPHLLSA